MKGNFARSGKPHPCFYLIAGCVAFFLPASAQTAGEALPAPVVEKPAPVETPIPAPYDRPRMPMTDVLIHELIKGEPINDVQVKEVINREFGKVWNNKEDPFPVDPKDSKEVRSAKYQTWIYLAAVKASFIDIENHGGWPTGYGKMREEGFPARMLVELKALAALPLDKVNRTMVNFSIITPAWISGDREAIAKSVKQLNADWPNNPYIARKISRTKGMAESMFPKE
ncbi:MAG: hypothetical protein ABIS50_14100 [Luteolibacter sp.]|uniref:hypothetical protein n=1 Tax=Luteolibacter sp. TaxID=1962973 RepID=UPI0032655A8D